MVTIGIIGTGYWGPNFVRVFSQIKESKVKWCSDLNEDNLIKIRNSYPSINTTKDYNNILNDDDVDAIIIVTPTCTHYKIAKDCLLKNKHILVEKPLTLKSEESQELIKLAEERNKNLMVGYIFKFNGAIKKIKEYIENKEIGDILYLYCSRSGLGPIRSDINTMWDLAPHDLSIILHLLKEKPISVTANGASYIQKGKEDVVFMNIEFENKIIANIHTSWLGPVKVREMNIVGQNKMLVFNDNSTEEKIKIFNKGVSFKEPSNFGEYQFIINEGDIIIPKIELKEPLKEECLHFIDCIKNNKKPISDGIDGLNVVKILEAAQKSLESNGTRIYLK